MEKAILKTLIYADIFDYPLKIQEIHKWLIGRKVTLRQVEKALRKLNQESRQGPASKSRRRGERGSPSAARIKNQGESYCLPGRNGLITQRKRKEKQSTIYLRKAKLLSQLLKMVPWIKLVGVSGGLALNNAGKKDDIDLFIITDKNRLWISRLFILGLLSLTEQRRKKGEMGKKIAGKLCINTLLEETRLEQQSKDIFVAHEVLQMRVLWQRDGIYGKYLEDNSWAFKFLPNWISTSSVLSLRAPHRSVRGRGNLQRTGKIASSLSLLAMTGIENLAKWLQLKIMSKPQGMERIEEGALYFHPEDCRLKILAEYKARLKQI